MRSKEEAHDYRYFPEPDLPPVEVSDEWVEEIRQSLPELPEARRQRFVKEYGLPQYDAGVLTQSVEMSEYFEAEGSNPSLSANDSTGSSVREPPDRVRVWITER